MTFKSMLLCFKLIFIILPLVLGTIEEEEENLVKMDPIASVKVLIHVSTYYKFLKIYIRVCYIFLPS
jgi:hypothetical protein